MKFCQKCHCKTEVRSGRVRVMIETTIVEAESPVFACPKCGINYASVQVTVIPDEKPPVVEKLEEKPAGAVIQ